MCRFANAHTRQHNEYQAPAHYIATGRHELFTRYVTKADVKAQVDKICAEGFDLYINNVVRLRPNPSTCNFDLRLSSEG
jgi:hypothetical protein